MNKKFLRNSTKRKFSYTSKAQFRKKEKYRNKNKTNWIKYLLWIWIKCLFMHFYIQFCFLSHFLDGNKWNDIFNRLSKPELSLLLALEIVSYLNWKYILPFPSIQVNNITHVLSRQSKSNVQFCIGNTQSKEPLSDGKQKTEDQTRNVQCPDHKYRDRILLPRNVEPE